MAPAFVRVSIAANQSRIVITGVTGEFQVLSTRHVQPAREELGIRYIFRIRDA